MFPRADYYRDSVALSLSAGRRSRVCVYHTYEHDVGVRSFPSMSSLLIVHRIECSLDSTPSSERFRCLRAETLFCLAEGLQLDHWKLDFSKLSFTLSRGRYITWGVSVFFPSDASVTCFGPLHLSTSGQLLRSEVFTPTSPVSNGDVIRADTAHRAIVIGDER